MTDINTVFYFADNLSLYEANQGKLSSYTISFVPQGNGVGYIYKNNVKYGGVSADELIDIIKNTPGIIPFASTSKAGIIKLGDGLVAADDSGTVRVNFDSVLERIPSAIQAYFDRNPISGGSDVKYTQTVTSGTELGTIRINGEDKKIFAPTIPQQKDYSLYSASLNGTTLTISQKDGSHVEANLGSIAGQGLPTPLTNYSITGISLTGDYLSITQGEANNTKGISLSSIAGGNEYELLPASSTTLGGIKTGGLPNDSLKRYPVRLDDDKNAYVDVPWDSNPPVVVEGYIVDLVNGTMVVVTDKQGNTGNYSNTAQIHVYNNGVEYNDFTVTIGDPTLSDGSAIPAGKVSATYANNNVTVTLNNLSGFSAKTLSIPLTVTLGNGSTRPLVITCVGVSIGADGEPGSSINLKTSAAAIRTDYYKNNAYPTSIDVWASITSGSSNIQTINIVPGSEDAERIGFSFKYHYNGGNDVDLTSGTISNIDPSKDGLVVELYYNGIRIASDDIPYVRDGAPGIGVSAINYRINVLSSNVIVSDGTNGKVVNGDVRFVITRQEGSNAPQEITDVELEEQEFSDGIITLTCLMDTRSKTAVYSNGAWTISTEAAYLGSPYSAIYVRSATNTMLASAIVPFIIKGEKGEGGGGQVQPLSGVVMRMVNWQDGVAYHDGTVADNNGIMYMDVVLYSESGYYYRPTVDGISGTPAEYIDNEWVTKQGWSMFFPQNDAAFQALIAKYAFIENLTAREIVITKEDNTLEAGITSGTAINTGSDPLSGLTRGDIRIWAGTPENANLGTCPFYVTNTGHLKTTNAELSGNIIINTSNGNVLINENGVEIKKGGDGIKVDSNGISRWDGNDWIPFYAGRKILHKHFSNAGESYSIDKNDDLIVFDINTSQYNIGNYANNPSKTEWVSFTLPPILGDNSAIPEGKIYTIRSIVGNAKIYAGFGNKIITGGNPDNIAFDDCDCINGNRVEFVLVKVFETWCWLMNSSGSDQ